MATTPEKTHIAASLLSRAHSPDTTTTIFKEKIKQRPLLLRPSSPDRALDARARRQKACLAKEKAQRKSQKPKPLSAKQKRAICIYDIPKEQRKYAIYEPLHDLWCGYMREVLGLEPSSAGTAARSHVTPSGAGPLLVSADYHGALIEVVRSRSVSHVGLRGIVVKDTKFTFEIITSVNELKTIPKEYSIFRFEVPLPPRAATAMLPEEYRAPVSFEVHGSQFKARAPDRANKKFRMHVDPDLNVAHPAGTQGWAQPVGLTSNAGHMRIRTRKSETTPECLQEVLADCIAKRLYYMQ